MKLLPKQEINKAKAQERKQEIDTGLVLAKRVDALRESRVKEEEQLKAWRTNSIAKIQTEIDEYITVRENLQLQTEKAEIFRQELIKPLDEEWSKVNIAKNKLKKDEENLSHKVTILEKDRKEVQINQEQISELITKSKSNEYETEKAKLEIIALKDLAQKEYEIARGEHEGQTDSYEKKMLDLRQLQNSYEIGIKTNETKEKILNEKESELITRERDLERRTRNFERARKVAENK